MNDPAKLFEGTTNTFGDLHARAIEASRAMVFDGSHDLHAHCIALYGTILELSESSVDLANRRQLVAAKIVLRSVFEAVVDLVNLTQEPAFGHCIEFESLDENAKFLRALLSDRNPNAAGMNLEKVRESLASTEQRRDASGQKGGRKVSRYEKCERIGLSHEYGTTYRHLCGEAHHNRSILIGRHVVARAGGHEFVYYADPRDEALEIVVGIAASLLVRATTVIHGLLGNPARDIVEQIVRDFDQSYAAREALENADTDAA